MSPKQQRISPLQSDDPFSLIILNVPIAPSRLFLELWKRSSVRVCADGGANRLYAADPSLLPNRIVGDLDSLQPHIRTYYESRGCHVIRDPNQDNNDLQKAIQSITDINRVVVFGALDGRFDQTMASIQALYQNVERDIWLYTDHACSFLLKPNVQHDIRIEYRWNAGLICGSQQQSQAQLLGEGPTCGLLPIGMPVDQVKTTGLQWNLDHQAMSFGGLVSTSNRIIADTVTVESSQPLVFTAEVHCGNEELQF